MADELKRQENLVPIPDPTLLTTAQLQLAIRNLEDKFGIRFDDLQHRISSMVTLMETKISALDHASVGRYEQLRAISEERINGVHELFAERELRTKAISDHISVAREEAVKNARDAIDSRNLILAHEEKFKSVQQQFRDAKTAIDAALASAKDAVDKQNAANTTASYKAEAAFSKQIDELRYSGQQAAKASDEKINDLKERIQAMEGVRKGGSDVIGWIVGLAGIVIAGITLTVTIVRHL